MTIEYGAYHPLALRVGCRSAPLPARGGSRTSLDVIHLPVCANGRDLRLGLRANRQRGMNARSGAACAYAAKVSGIFKPKTMDLHALKAQFLVAPGKPKTNQVEAPTDCVTTAAAFASWLGRGYHGRNKAAPCQELARHGGAPSYGFAQKKVTVPSIFGENGRRESMSQSAAAPALWRVVLAELAKFTGLFSC